MNELTVTLDVREDIRAGREPFSRIMQTVAQLRDGQALHLIAPFQPTPLFAVLARQGFAHKATPLEGSDWEVRFSKDKIAESVEVDARGLEPPQPLVTILEALTRLPGGAHLRARTDRKPMHLYSQLAERGYAGETQEQSDGSFITDIRRQ